MNDFDKIREQIKRMRKKGVEPEIVSINHDVWASLGHPHSFSGVRCCVSDTILGRFEVR